eukprot:tig00001065_g6738.t1
MFASRIMAVVRGAATGAAKPAPKAAAAAAAKPATSSNRGAALLVPLKPSPQLAEVIGTSAPLPRGEVVKRVWEYIHKHKLQNEANKREVKCDAKLTRVFGTSIVTITGILGGVSKHLTK